MADEVDVENALAGLVSAALYPNGTGQPCAAGVPVKVFRGWPTPQAQELAKANNFVNVSIACRNGVERNTTRFPPIAEVLSGPVHTLTATVANNTITIGGTVSTPQNIVILMGMAFITSYKVLVTDTLSSVATGLAALINVGFPGTTATGPVVTAPPQGWGSLIARVTGAGQVITETKRQEKSFQISIWAPPCNVPSNDADTWRYSVAKVLDPALSLPSRIALPDATQGWIHYERTITFDTAQAEGLYRRDLFYWVEYGTNITTTAYEIGVNQTQVVPDMGLPTGDFNGPFPVPNLFRANTLPTTNTNS